MGELIDFLEWKKKKEEKDMEEIRAIQSELANLMSQFEVTTGPCAYTDSSSFDYTLPSFYFQTDWSYTYGDEDEKG